MLDSPQSAEPLPVFKKVGLALGEIFAGKAVGDRLPAERQLCVDLGVSRGTLRRALEFYYRTGVIKRSPGGGAWLAQSPSTQTPEPAKPKTNRFIGLVVPSIKISLISRIVQGAQQCAAERGFHIALAHDHFDVDYQIKQLTHMLDCGISGVAVYPDNGNILRPEFVSVLRQFKQQRLPLVMLDLYVPDLDVRCILSDNFQGMYTATEHMILAGHRRLGLLAFGPEGSISERHRRKGFLAALKDYNLAPEPVFEAHLGLAGLEVTAEKVMADYLAEHNGKLPLDGLVCMEENMAYGAFIALKKAGLQVPSDVGLIAYGDLDESKARAVDLELTEVAQPAEEMGYETVRLLIDEIEGKKSDLPSKHVLLTPRLIVRGSCGTVLLPPTPDSDSAVEAARALSPSPA